MHMLSEFWTISHVPEIAKAQKPHARLDYVLIYKSLYRQHTYLWGNVVVGREFRSLGVLSCRNRKRDLFCGLKVFFCLFNY